MKEYKLKSQVVTCIVCLGKYIRTIDENQEECLPCIRKAQDEFREELRILTPKIIARNKMIETLIKRYKHKYHIFMPRENWSRAEWEQRQEEIIGEI